MWTGTANQPTGGAVPISDPPVGAEWLDWLAARGEMGARVVAFDWSATPLGPIQGWPVHLRSAVGLCLGSLFPMSVRWGEDLIVIYNDACREIYGAERFASALGRPTAAVWPEVADRLGAQLDSIMNEGQPFFAADLLVPINRDVPLEECYFTFSYTPIVGETGRPDGILATFIETTDEVLAERRMQTLAELARGLSASRTIAEVGAEAMTVLAANPMDHPAGALYAVGDAGRGPLDLIATFGDPFDHGRANDLVHACIRTGVPQHAENGDAQVSL